MRFLIAGTLAGGLLLTILNFITAAILPPRYKQFKDPQAVTDAVRANVADSDIYTAPQGLFVSVSFQPRMAGVGARLAVQTAVECMVAFGLSVILLASPIRPPLHAAALLGLLGLVAGIETHFPNWNWAGFPTSYLLAGSTYLGCNWFLAGLLLGFIRRKTAA